MLRCISIFLLVGVYQYDGSFSRKRKLIQMQRMLVGFSKNRGKSIIAILRKSSRHAPRRRPRFKLLSELMKRQLAKCVPVGLSSIKEIKQALDDGGADVRELLKSDLWSNSEPVLTSGRRKVKRSAACDLMLSLWSIGLFLAAIDKEQNGQGRATWRNSEFWQKVDAQNSYTVKIKHKKVCC